MKNLKLSPKFKKKKKKKKGFTLMEFLVVIFIVAILSVTAILYLSPVRAKARDSRRKNDLRVIQLANELFYGSNGNYPANLEGLESQGFVSDVPEDPKEEYFYTYHVSANGQSYEIDAKLEEDETSMQNDGGSDTDRYEIGTDLDLISHDCNPLEGCIATPPMPDEEDGEPPPTD